MTYLLYIYSCLIAALNTLLLLKTYKTGVTERCEKYEEAKGVDGVDMYVKSVCSNHGSLSSLLCK